MDLMVFMDFNGVYVFKNQYIRWYYMDFHGV